MMFTGKSAVTGRDNLLHPAQLLSRNGNTAAGNIIIERRRIGRVAFVKPTAISFYDSATLARNHEIPFAMLALLPRKIRGTAAIARGEVVHLDPCGRS